jgi:hypothetical protein
MKGPEKSRSFNALSASKGRETMAKKPTSAAKPKAAKTEETTKQVEGATPGLFVLKKNHGLTFNGRTNKFFAAGTTFDPAKDGVLISQLVRSGARIEEVPAEAEPAEESTEQTGDTKPETDSQPEGDQSDAQE